MPNLPYSSQASQAFGGVVLTINSNLFVARNWKPERKSREIRRNDENGDQAAFMLRAEPASQSGLTLQLANSNVTPPFVGNTFTGPDSVNYVVTGAGFSKPQGEFWICDIDYKSVANITD